MSTVTMQELELEHAELLPSRETLTKCGGGGGYGGGGGGYGGGGYGGGFNFNQFNSSHNGNGDGNGNFGFINVGNGTLDGNLSGDNVQIL